MENAMFGWLVFGAIVFGTISLFIIIALVFGIIKDYVIPVIDMNIKEIKESENDKSGLTDSDNNEPTNEGGRYEKR